MAKHGGVRMIYESTYYNPNYLSHHGVKGIKWGVRKYQNPDGSLTAEGKKKISEQIANIKRCISFRRLSKSRF